MYRLAASVRCSVHSRSFRTPWASQQIKLATRCGAPSLATFKYYSTVSCGHLIPSESPSDHDSKAIQDTFEGLLLMSLLRYLYAFPPFVPFSGSPSFSLRPDFGPDGLPILPKIESGEIEMRIFTHRSFAARPTHVFEDSPDDPSPDNEQSVVPRNCFCDCRNDNPPLKQKKA